MSIDKLAEFAKDGDKNLDNLDVSKGFLQSEKPERQWFNKLFNLLTSKVNEVVDNIDGLPPFDGGVLADTFVVVDGSLSQRTINKGLESIADLSTINNPKDGLRVYVKSYHAGLNKGGGDFVYDSAKSTINDGGVIFNGWVRQFDGIANINFYGASPSATSTVNSNAINAALANNKTVIISKGVYQIAPDIINLKTGNHLINFGRLEGESKDFTAKADGQGAYINAVSANDIVIDNLDLSNGYKGVGVNIRGCKNVTMNKPRVDGFTYGIWGGELNFEIPDTNGCQNIIINEPKILNTRYWGMYFRGYGITTDAKKTKNICVIKPYFYNCHMAAFVCAEGHVYDVTVDTPYFERCNVCMHFELATNYTIINPRDKDTGKKPDHLQANTEYPFVNWSLYNCFSKHVEVIGGRLTATVQHLGTKGGEVQDIKYTGLHAKNFVFEGGGESPDADKNLINGVSFDHCTTDDQFIYQQPTDIPMSYIRNLKINNCECLLEGANNGTAVAVAILRGVDIQVTNNTFHNACLRITSEGVTDVKNNVWLKGTDNTQSIFNGVTGGLSGSFLNFTGNVFKRAGGVVVGSSAIKVTNYTNAKIDNVVRGNGVNYAYELTDLYRVEYGAGMVYDTNSGEHFDTNITAFIFTFRA